MKWIILAALLFAPLTHAAWQESKPPESILKPVTNTPKITFDQIPELYPAAARSGVTSNGWVYIYNSEGESLGAIGRICPPKITTPPPEPPPAVPIPTASILFGSAVFGLVVAGRRRRGR